ncbi:hypothetical protein [Rhodococcus sp. MEB041]|uniref:hypothetical protein n=1 Tax=Rhodococcus sp. MEB041 TaxID=3040323 RepID=UPI00254B3AEC|nr:hypothetical protein [Rhodococcus sp. MEB041]
MSSKGNFDASWVEKLAARLAPFGVTLWVPQIVVWEWAEHAAAAQNEVLPTLRALDRLDIPGMATGPWLTAPEISDRIEARLRAMPNVEVVPAHGPSAVQAIKDQVLQTGPGTRKSKVKTGAADSALVRDAVEHLGGRRLGELAILSGNSGDMRKTLDTIPRGNTVEVFTNEPALINGLKSFRAALQRQETERRQEDVKVRNSIVEHFQREEQELRDDDDGHGVPTESWVTELVTDLGLEALPTYNRGQFDQVTSVQVHPNSHVVGISGVSIDDSEAGSTRYAAFDLTLETVVQIEGYTLDGDGSIVMGSDEVDTLLEVGCVAELDGSEVVGVRQVEKAIASDMVLDFGDEGDARDWLADYVCAATNAQIKDEPFVWGNLPEQKTLVTPTGEVVASIYFEEPHHDDRADGSVWTATFCLGPANDPLVVGAIDCIHDVSAQVPTGDGDYYDMYPAYRLRPDGPDLIRLLNDVADAVVEAEIDISREDPDE